ncbi:Tn3 family transposase [Clostridium massiliamazoniense]|uniref:Tn3 family transposase n=1 Tax=Clostridium massiliamazoniense TaxID=1347366 RepID=UPI0006D7C847
MSCFKNEIQKSDTFRIQRLSNENKKYAYLIMFLYFRRKDFVDMAIEINCNYAHKVLKRNHKKALKYNMTIFKNYQINFNKLKNLLDTLIEINDFDEFKKYKSSLIKLKEECDFEADEIEDIDFLIKNNKGFNYINELLKYIKFNSNTKLDLIKLINNFSSYKHKKRLSLDISFFNGYWQKYIKKYNYSKKIIEIALIYTIRDNIRSGDLFVKESGKYNSLDYYLVEPFKDSMNDETILFLQNLKNSFNSPPKDIEFNLDIEKDSKSLFITKIYSYFPKITMTEMIYEVNTWTNFLDAFNENFYSSISQKQQAIIATLLANGHNIGFSKMSLSSSIPETILRRVNEYYFNHNTLSKSQITNDRIYVLFFLIPYLNHLT